MPTREQTRLLALAAAAQSNPFGLSESGEAACTDAREFLAWSRETLGHMERCFATAHEELEADIAVAAAEGKTVASEAHARKMLEGQKERLRVVRAFVAKQEALVE